jgi:hypothetical protein
MSAINDDQRQNLMQTYSGLSDEELLTLARHSSELTEPARAALNEQMVRRGLDINLADDEEPASPEAGDLLTVRQFRDLPEALLAKGMLESAGITCFLHDDNMVRMDWLISNLLGGIKLLVRAQDLDLAEEILQEPIPESFEIEGVGNYEQPRCPNCNALDITLQALNKPIAYTSAYIGLPLPIGRDLWKCEACGCTRPNAKEAE